MSTPSLLGPEWDTGGWMYVALDLDGTLVIKVGYTRDPRQRNKKHSRWGLTTVCQWAVSSHLIELDWHEDHRRYRRRSGDPDTRRQLELYDPHRPLVDSILLEVERAEAQQCIKWANGWSANRLYNELDQRAMAYLDEDLGWG